MSSPNEDKSNLRKQAFYDSHTSYKVNIDKYKNISDPILQQKDKYVSHKYINKKFYRNQKNPKNTLNQIITIKILI